MKKVVIEQSIFGKYPSAKVGVIVAKNINNVSSSEEITARLREEEKRIREGFVTETLSQHPKINCWRKAYSAFGSKGGEYKSSVEALYRRVIKGGKLRPINPLVDIYNYISLKHMMPVGGEDLDNIEGDIYLTFAGSNEVPVLLLGDEEAKTPTAGEVIYKDNISAICRRWNWREADRTKLTENTKSAILVIDGIDPLSNEEIASALDEFETLIRRHCGCITQKTILDKSNPELVFE
ncbi:MAG: phenylalanine--tRNA ligase beta subunit-related protein [Patescibacteria group bacterium]|jgi:DNA/RNA-binding domain of Phe-tRNA-synthetase-like protein